MFWCFVLSFPHKGPDPANQRKPRPRARRTSGPGRPSVPSSCSGWKRSSRRTGTSPSSGGRTWPWSSASTSLRSKSGSRTSGPRLKRPPGRRTLWRSTWWRRGCTTTPPAGRRRPAPTATEAITSPASWAGTAAVWHHTVLRAGLFKARPTGLQPHRQISWNVLDVEFFHLEGSAEAEGLPGALQADQNHRLTAWLLEPKDSSAASW